MVRNDSRHARQSKTNKSSKRNRGPHDPGHSLFQIKQSLKKHHGRHCQGGIKIGDLCCNIQKHNIGKMHWLKAKLASKLKAANTCSHTKFKLRENLILPSYICGKLERSVDVFVGEVTPLLGKEILTEMQILRNKKCSLFTEHNYHRTFNHKSTSCML